jgi:flagellar motor switch/type III secretory pathway protein FliN
MRDLSRPSQRASPAVAQTGVRSRFLSERSEWKRYQKRNMGKTISEKKDGTAITKTEMWAKPSQKVKNTHRHHSNEGHTNKKNTAMNMKKSNEANTKPNMNMNMQVKMKMNMKMKMKMKMKTGRNVKRNMVMNMKININENLSEYAFGHECHDAWEEECGLLTRR